MYQTYHLWIEEPVLHDAKVFLPALPPQYKADLLLKLFQNESVSSHLQIVKCFIFVDANIRCFHMYNKWTLAVYILCFSNYYGVIFAFNE